MLAAEESELRLLLLHRPRCVHVASLAFEEAGPLDSPATIVDMRTRRDAVGGLVCAPTPGRASLLPTDGDTPRVLL